LDFIKLNLHDNELFLIQFYNIYLSYIWD